MRDDVVLSILNHCLAVDSKAVLIYSKFASQSKKKALKEFWNKLSAHEEKHTTYWRKLIKLAKDDMLPELFEQPYRVKEQFEDLQKKVEALLQESDAAMDTTSMFLVACRMEFNMVQPALISFLNFLETFPNQESPIADYRSHLAYFIEGLNKFGPERPELKLLGETIDRLWKDNSTLAMLSNTDSLTGIYNRRGLFDALIPLIYLAQRKKLGVGVMIVDIDDFKAVNDKQGHQQGDNILTWVANTLKSNIRISDVVGRYGGEEFIIYLSDVNLEFISKIAEKLRKQVESGSKDKTPITVSIGATGGHIGKDIDQDLDEMIRRADENLYKAKAAGKNRAVVNGNK